MPRAAQATQGRQTPPPCRKAYCIGQGTCHRHALSAAFACTNLSSKSEFLTTARSLRRMLSSASRGATWRRQVVAAPSPRCQVCAPSPLAAACPLGARRGCARRRRHCCCRSLCGGGAVLPASRGAAGAHHNCKKDSHRFPLRANAREVRMGICSVPCSLGLGFGISPPPPIHCVPHGRAADTQPRGGEGAPRVARVARGCA
eukprot:gene18713-biopygen12975